MAISMLCVDRPRVPRLPCPFNEISPLRRSLGLGFSEANHTVTLEMVA